MSTGSTTGVCAQATLSCNQLYAYLLLIGQISGNLEIAYILSQHCTPGANMTIYATLPSQAACQSAVGNASAFNLYGLTGTICGTTNCNAQIAPSPLPAAASPAVPTLTVSTTLSGYTQATFTQTAKTAFVSAVATTLNVATTAVAITNVANSAARRHLLAGGVVVSYSVTTAVPLASVTSSLNSAAFTTALTTTFTAAALTVPAPSAVIVAVAQAPAAPSAAAAVASGVLSLAAAGITALLM